MKTLSLVILLAVAFILFLVGISIPGTDDPVHIALVVISVILGFIFYLKVFREVRTTRSLSRGERTLWTIVIVCLPVIGNLLYVIIHHSAASKQTPTMYEN